MMKKCLAVLLIMAVLCGLSVVPVAAVETIENVIAVYEDGSYLVEEIRIETSAISPWSNAIATAGQRVIRNYDAFNVEQWNFTLYVNFLYREGISAIVQNGWIDHEIYSSHWKLESSEFEIQQPAAYGSYVFKKRALLIVVATDSDTIGLTCDAYGNISRC